MIAAAVEAAGGLCIVGLVASDIFRSILVPRATRRTLRLGPLIGDGLLRLTLSVTAGRFSARRHDILGGLGPLLLVVNTSIWLGSAILGFALAMHAAGPGFDPPLGAVEAIYASASSFLTLGISGHAVPGVWARSLVIGAALCGFGLVPLVVTFVLNIQGALSQREQLVLRLGVRDGKPVNGLAVLQLQARLGAGREVATIRFFDDWDRWAANVIVTHSAFPVLTYFRSADRHCDWIAALGATLDAAAMLAIFDTDAESGPAILYHRLGSRLAQELAATFRCAAGPDRPMTRSWFDEVAQLLTNAGLAAPPHPDVAYDRFIELRSHHEAAILGLCLRFGVPHLLM